MMGHLQVNSKFENERISVDCLQSPFFPVKSSYHFPSIKPFHSLFTVPCCRDRPLCVTGGHLGFKCSKSSLAMLVSYGAGDGFVHGTKMAKRSGKRSILTVPRKNRGL